MSQTPPTYLKYPPPEHTNKLDRISQALTGTEGKRFKQALRRYFGSGEIERKTVLDLLWALDRRRIIQPGNYTDLVQILRDMQQNELIREEFPEFYEADSTVSDGELDWLASKMGSEWESFARQQLEIPQSKIDQCKASVYPVNLHQQIFKVLSEWKRRQGCGATQEALESKLLQCEDFDKTVLSVWNERLHHT